MACTEDVLKKIIILFFCVMTLVSCRLTNAISETPEMIASSYELTLGTWSPDADNRIIPWEGDAALLAKADKSLRFYFMAGEGCKVPGVGEKIGDSCLIVFPNGKLMLVDACSAAYSGILIKNLKKLGVRHIDYLLLTHGHSDHYAGFTEAGGIGDVFTIGKVYYDGTVNSGNTKILKKCANLGIPFDFLREGQSLSIGDVAIDILNPTLDVIGKQITVEKEQNDTSITMMLTYGKVKALFTGDLYKSGMQAVNRRYGEALEADIIKIPHHGHSETSLFPAFATSVSPSYAVASSGVPLNSSVYEMWTDKGGSKVLGDYMEGYIVIGTDGKTIDVKTSRTRETSYYDKFDGAETAAPAYMMKPDLHEYYSVGTIDSLLAAITAGKQYIRLNADIDVSSYTTESPFVLDLTGKSLDLNGHVISGIRSTTKDIANTTQTTNCSLIVKGKDFTLKNGKLAMANDKGGYALQINTSEDQDPSANTGIVLEALTLPNGGLSANGCTILLRGCYMKEPSTCTTNRATICLHHSDCTLESGTYVNEADYAYQRYLKVLNSTVRIKNDVRYSGTLLYSVSYSLFYLERTLL